MAINLWFRFVLAVLALWRVTHLLAAEDGPWDVIVRLRRAAGNGVFGRLMDCFYCLSLWLSIPFAPFVAGVADGHTFVNWLVAWLAISGGACLLNRLVREPLVFGSLNPGDKS